MSHGLGWELSVVGEHFKRLWSGSTGLSGASGVLGVAAAVQAIADLGRDHAWITLLVAAILLFLAEFKLAHHALRENRRAQDEPPEPQAARGDLTVSGRDTSVTNVTGRHVIQGSSVMGGIAIGGDLPAPSPRMEAFIQAMQARAIREREREPVPPTFTPEGREIVFLYDLAKSADFRLFRRSFERLSIHGPAIINPAATTFDSRCHFNVAHPRSLYWPWEMFRVGAQEFAPVGFFQVTACEFVDCEFTGIGISGTAPNLERIRAQLGH